MKDVDADALPNILKMMRAGDLIAVYMFPDPESILFIPSKHNPKNGPFLNAEEVKYMFDLLEIREAAKWN